MTFGAVRVAKCSGAIGFDPRIEKVSFADIVLAATASTPALLFERVEHLDGQAGERGYANLEWEDDCAAREKYAEAANLQFLAVERWLDVSYVAAPDCRARFFFVTCLREPLARYRSHLAFEHVSEEDAVAWAEQLQVPRDDPVRRGTAVVDNFYVRSLLGREFFFGTEAGNISIADARRAKAVLAQFDAVLILERLEASLCGLHQ